MQNRIANDRTRTLQTIRIETGGTYMNDMHKYFSGEEQRTLRLISDILEILSDDDKENFCKQTKYLSFYDLQNNLAKQGYTLEVKRI